MQYATDNSAISILHKYDYNSRRQQAEIVQADFNST